MSAKKVTPGFCIQQSFPLFEQLVEASKGWELGFRQLSAASSPFRLEQLSTSRMLYSRVHLGSHFHQLGGPELGFRTFALRSEVCTDFRWCGETVNRNSLIVLPSDGEFESVSLPGFDIFTVSLCFTLLERTAEIQFQRPLGDFMGDAGQVFHLSEDKMHELRRLLHRLSSDVAQSSALGTPLENLSRTRRIELELVYLVLACLDRGEAQTPRVHLSKRMRALGRALELIGKRPQRGFCISDLVEQVGVSRRTLEYAFLDGVGVSPAAYLKATRLKALHQDLLLTGSTQASVASLCLLHGFSHLGQLAADYRLMFGERPSATLRRWG